MVTLLRRPGQALAPFVDLLWYVEDPVASGFERRLPTGGMQIVVNLAADELHWYAGDRFDRPQAIGGAGLSGPIARPIGIDAADQRRTVGVAFRPGGAAPFVSPPAGALTEPLVDLEDLWGRAGAVLRERLMGAATPAAALALLESCLLDQAIAPLEPDRALGAAVRALEQGCAVHHVVDRTGMSPSTLGRMFRRLVGLSPKPYARLRRLQRVLDTVTRPGGSAWPGPLDWAAVAAEHAYFDQSHLINEFRAFTGTTPTAYRPRSHLDRNHLPITG